MSSTAAFASAPLATSDDAHTPNGRGWRQLVHWHQAHEEVAFLYSRSLGGLIQSGRGRVARLDADWLTIESGACALLIVLGKARYEFGPKMFFSPDLFHRFNVEGVAINLANHDWLFITVDASSPALGYPAPPLVLPVGKQGA